MIRNDKDSYFKNPVTQLRRENERMQGELVATIRQLEQDIQSAVKNLKDHMEKHEVGTCIGQITPSTPSINISKLSERGKIVSRAMKVLATLHFPDRESRQTRIVEAHYETFNWAWKAHFKKWMTSNDFLFWVRLLRIFILFEKNKNN